MTDSGSRDLYLDMLIARWIKVAHEIKTLERQRDELAKLILAEQEMVAGTRRGGVAVVRQTRFSATRAKEFLDPEDYEAICERVPSIKRAEKVLDPEVLEKLRVPSGKRFLRLTE